jgi:hypothetical protein
MKGARMDSRQLRMRTVGGTLLALMLMPVAWYAVAVAFLAGGRYLGGGEAGALETWVRVSWFVAPPVSGFIALWATGSLLKGVPLWNVFLAFSICIRPCSSWPCLPWSWAHGPPSGPSSAACSPSSPC